MLINFILIFESNLNLTELWIFIVPFHRHIWRFYEKTKRTCQIIILSPNKDTHYVIIDAYGIHKKA